MRIIKGAEFRRGRGEGEIAKATAPVILLLKTHLPFLQFGALIAQLRIRENLTVLNALKIRRNVF